MESSVQQASKLLTVCAIVALAGCAAQPKPPVPMSAPVKPFKVCPEDHTEKDEPCTKLGPTNSPSDRGMLNIQQIYAIK